MQLVDRAVMRLSKFIERNLLTRPVEDQLSVVAGLRKRLDAYTENLHIARDFELNDEPREKLGWNYAEMKQMLKASQYARLRDKVQELRKDFSRRHINELLTKLFIELVDEKDETAINAVADLITDDGFFPIELVFIKPDQARNFALRFFDEEIDLGLGQDTRDLIISRIPAEAVKNIIWKMVDSHFSETISDQRQADIFFALIERFADDSQFMSSIALKFKIAGSKNNLVSERFEMLLETRGINVEPIEL